jgi:DNA polymerase-3 subunit epsilon
MDQNRFIAIDVETTGFSPSRGDRVIEVGAVVVEHRRIVDEFQSLVNINKSIPRSATLIHGITTDMLDGQPAAEDVYPKLRTLFSDATLIAHNAQFDIRFLRHEFGRMGFGLQNKYLCTLEMSRRRFPRLHDHTLVSVVQHLFGEIPRGAQRHRALDDARMVARVWIEFMKK